MKKTVAIVIMLMYVFIFTVACGSSSEEETYNSDWAGALTTSQGVQIEQIGDEVVVSYSKQTEIDAFIDELAIDEWATAELEDDAEREYLVSFFKEGSINADNADGEEDNTKTVVGRIITYKGSSIITLESLGLSLEFDVPQSALDVIRDAQ